MLNAAFCLRKLFYSWVWLVWSLWPIFSSSPENKIALGYSTIFNAFLNGLFFQGNAELFSQKVLAALLMGALIIALLCNTKNTGYLALDEPSFLGSDMLIDWAITYLFLNFYAQVVGAYASAFRKTILEQSNWILLPWTFGSENICDRINTCHCNFAEIIVANCSQESAHILAVPRERHRQRML